MLVRQRVGTQFHPGALNVQAGLPATPASAAAAAVSV
jgi:hypothetical protein